MTRRISPLWWPVLAAASPLAAPLLALGNARYQKNRRRARDLNRERMHKAAPLDLPALEYLEITPLVEWRTAPGFLPSPGVSYLIRTDRGALLFDVGFGPESPALRENAARLGFDLSQVDALCISHLHLDHMGGMKAARRKSVELPPDLGNPGNMPCFLPDAAKAAGFRAEKVDGPGEMAAGVGTTGPLARSLFFMGFCEEQVLVARLKGRGLVLITGCGHPGLGTIMDMAGRLSEEPLHALAGGLHYPLTESRLKKPGLELAMIFGTGKQPWRPINEADLDLAIGIIRKAAPSRLLLSAHDTCDHALARFQGELDARTEVLEAGAAYRL